jgi:hypothetical protein
MNEASQKTPLNHEARDLDKMTEDDGRKLRLVGHVEDLKHLSTHKVCQRVYHVIITTPTADSQK